MSSILIIENDPGITSYYIEILRNEGIKNIITATNHDEGKDLIDIFNFNVVIMDLSIGVKQNGISLIEETHKIHPSCTLIVTSEYASHRSIIKAFYNLPVIFFIKPVKKQELIASIESGIKPNNTKQERHKGVRGENLYHCSGSSRKSYGSDHRYCGGCGIRGPEYQGRRYGRNPYLWNKTQYRLYPGHGKDGGGSKDTP